MKFQLLGCGMKPACLSPFEAKRTCSKVTRYHEESSINCSKALNTASAVSSFKLPSGATIERFSKELRGHGPKRSGGVGPKIASTRLPTAAERCIGPLSLPINIEGWRAKATISSNGQPVRLRNLPSGVVKSGTVGWPAHHATWLSGNFSKIRRVSASNPFHSFSGPRLSVKITKHFRGSLAKNDCHGKMPLGCSDSGIATSSSMPSVRANSWRIGIAWCGPRPTGSATFFENKLAPSRQSQRPHFMGDRAAAVIKPVRNKPCISQTISKFLARRAFITSKTPRIPFFR